MYNSVYIGQDSIHCIVFNAYYTFTLYCILHIILHTAQCAVCTLCTVHCVMLTIRCTVYTVQCHCTVLSVQCVYNTMCVYMRKCLRHDMAYLIHGHICHI